MTNKTFGKRIIIIIFYNTVFCVGLHNEFKKNSKLPGSQMKKEETVKLQNFHYQKEMENVNSSGEILILLYSRYFARMMTDL